MSTHLQIMLTTTLLPPSCDCLPHTQLSYSCTTTISLTPPTLTAYHTNITPGSQLPHTCTHTSGGRGGGDITLLKVHTSPPITIPLTVHTLPSHHHITHSPHPTLPTVHTGMMSSGKKVKYLAAMLRGLPAIIWRLVHV